MDADWEAELLAHTGKGAPAKVNPTQLCLVPHLTPALPTSARGWNLSAHHQDAAGFSEGTMLCYQGTKQNQSRRISVWLFVCAGLYANSHAGTSLEAEAECGARGQAQVLGTVPQSW